MAIKPAMVDFIRTFVRDEIEENDRLEAQLDQEGWDDYGLFLNAVFFLAIDHYFDGRRDGAAIIRFVGEMRSQLDVGGDEIDPVGAERLISSVFDPDVEVGLSPAMIGKVQTHATYKALTEKAISDRELDELLSEAAAVVNEREV
ncbi:hypothetical protein AB0J86_37275 [Micromonospora sp. NPDC049559]|uniref:hypothetical protein n=1 Tax=Micromonospora sp. NPDC049559 TaxID=3155923 RepID=UPI00342FA980